MTKLDNLEMNHLNLVKEKDWWRGAVIYQIYPRSFQDSNSDGIGDLQGIVQRLPYVASLGVDAIWISPFYRSPMRDFGYDVSDFRDVDATFGTLSDFDMLIDTAHRLGLKVMIDLVFNHTSIDHAWFEESRKDRTNPKSDWYVWADAKPDGTPPNNWLSIFGGSAWTWDPRREQYYLHNFLSSQPDLNLHCGEVQEELLDVARFWLHRGVDGFRLDVVNFYFHDPELRDNPPLPTEQRNASIAPAVNPYNHQLHIYSKNRPENIAFLKRLNREMAPFGAAAVGEVGDAQRGMEILAEYTADGDKVQMCYAFDFLSEIQPSAEHIVSVFKDVDAVLGNGWSCWAFSNHDVERHSSRWSLSFQARRAYISLLLCLRGSVCLYQGEELGLGDAEVPYNQIQDPYGREFWPEYKGRDGCRTPMPWNHTDHHAGFSNAVETWLPVSPDHVSQSVQTQEADPGSLLHHYRNALEFRRSNPVLQNGAQSGMSYDQNVLWFERSDENERLLCVFNLSADGGTFELPTGSWLEIGEKLGGSAASADGFVHLGPWQVFFAKENLREEN